MVVPCRKRTLLISCLPVILNNFRLNVGMPLKDGLKLLKVMFEVSGAVFNWVIAI